MKSRASLVAHGGSLMSGLCLALLPKCPLCFVAYGSAFGAFATRAGAHFAAIRGMLGVLVASSLALVLVLSWQRRDALPALLAGSGALTLLIGEVGSNQAAQFGGVTLLCVAAWLNARACRRSHAGGQRVH